MAPEAGFQADSRCDPPVVRSRRCRMTEDRDVQAAGPSPTRPSERLRPERARARRRAWRPFAPLTLLAGALVAGLVAVSPPKPAVRDPVRPRTVEPFTLKD